MEKMAENIDTLKSQADQKIKEKVVLKKNATTKRAQVTPSIVGSIPREHPVPPSSQESEDSYSQVLKEDLHPETCELLRAAFNFAAS